MPTKKVESMIHADGVDISVVTTVGSEDDYISLTDIAKYHNPELPGYVIQNWMRNRSAVEFLGLWEQLNNPEFNCVDFEAIKQEAGSNRSQSMNKKQPPVLEPPEAWKGQKAMWAVCPFILPK